MGNGVLNNIVEPFERAIQNLTVIGHPMQRSSLFIASLIMILCSMQTVAAAGGEDVEPDISGSPIVAINHTVEAADQSDWSISVEINSDAANNNTSIRILRQMCTNEGVCDSPEWEEIEASENRTFWNSSWVTIDDHSYVNWKVSVDYDDGESEEYPPKGYAKAWSSCWYDIDADQWGGKDCPDGPPVDKSDRIEEESSIPSLSILSVVGVLGLAALLRRSS